MGEVVLQELMGEVARPDWLNFTIQFVREPTKFAFVFSIIVDIRSHNKPALEGERGGPRFVRGKQFTFQFDLPESVIQEFRSDVPKIYVRWVKSTLRDNAYKLYEFDPRIGWSWKGQDGLPQCPLFDPVDDFSRTGLPIEGKNGLLLRPSCAFCGEEHTDADPPVWTGGNMMWVHRKCRRVS